MFEYYQENQDRIESHTLLDFAETVTSHESFSVRAELSRLHTLVVPGAFKAWSCYIRKLANWLYENQLPEAELNEFEPRR